MNQETKKVRMKRKTIDEAELAQNDGQVTNRMNINIIAENTWLAVNLDNIWFLGVKYFIQ